MVIVAGKFVAVDILDGAHDKIGWCAGGGRHTPSLAIIHLATVVSRPRSHIWRV
jgi:hypothetical protein